MITVGLSLAGRPCLIVGGGAVALRRLEKLIGESAKICLVSPTIHEGIVPYVEEGLLEWIPQGYESIHMKGQQFVIIATNDEMINEEVMTDALHEGAFINRADVKDDSTWAFMSATTIGDLEISMSTNRISPRVSRLVREDMEQRYGVLQEWLPSIRSWRKELKELLPTPKERELFWSTYLGTKEFEDILQGQGDSVKENIIHAISRIRSKS